MTSETQKVAEVITEQDQRHGSCFCGKVSLTVTGRPRSCSACHCSVCRSLTGAPFSVQSLHARSNVVCNTSEPELWSLATSPHVTRYRCRDCGSPVYATLGAGSGRKIVAVPQSILFREGKFKDLSSDFQPMHHIYYANRVIDVNDALPKYVGTSAPGRGVCGRQRMATNGHKRHNERLKMCSYDMIETRCLCNVYSIVNGKLL